MSDSKRLFRVRYKPNNSWALVTTFATYSTRDAAERGLKRCLNERWTTQAWIEESGA